MANPKTREALFELIDKGPSDDWMLDRAKSLHDKPDSAFILLSQSKFHELNVRVTLSVWSSERSYCVRLRTGLEVFADTLIERETHAYLFGRCKEIMEDCYDRHDAGCARMVRDFLHKTEPKPRWWQFWRSTAKR